MSRLPPQDQRLVSALLMLGDQLPALVDEILAGQLDQDERRALAVVLATLAAGLDPALVVPGTRPAVTVRRFRPGDVGA